MCVVTLGHLAAPTSNGTTPKEAGPALPVVAELAWCLTLVQRRSG